MPAAGAWGGGVLGVVMDEAAYNGSNRTASPTRKGIQMLRPRSLFVAGAGSGSAKGVMRGALLMSAILSAQLTACSEGTAPAAENQTASSESAAAPPAEPTGEEGVRRYAECASTLDAVANLYSAIASQSSGADAEEMSRTASARSSAAREFDARAIDLASALPNAPPNLVGQLMSARNEQLEQERQRQPFEDFAVWLGREADQCAAIAPRPR